MSKSPTNTFQIKAVPAQFNESRGYTSMTIELFGKVLFNKKLENKTLLEVQNELKSIYEELKATTNESFHLYANLTKGRKPNGYDSMQKLLQIDHKI